jgi:electron-transferring-flavoprotein dehydrogenase
MDYDVLIVGGGPTGLSAAIRLRQLAEETGKDLSVCLIEKGYEPGAHLIAGSVLEPRALDELLPEWREMDDAPVDSPVTATHFRYLTKTGSLPVPEVPYMTNKGNYIVSIAQFGRFLGNVAENMGVDVFPGTPAAEPLYDEATGAVVGIATADMGIDKEGHPKDTFCRGMELRAKQTIFAEGARGNCSLKLMEQFGLDKECEPQVYGLGIKEVWEVPEDKVQPGLVQHSFGWPLGNTYGGTFLYHLAPNMVQVGIVVGLDYKNPYLNPYKEFQQVKHHPDIKKHLEGGECIAYGARVINEGGLQCLPKLSFPGGMLAGCAAGTVNIFKIKGMHTAMKSGMLAAESVFEAVTDEETYTEGANLLSYQNSMENSWVWEELKRVRNARPAFQYGTAIGAALSGLSVQFFFGKEPWTLPHKHRDSATTLPASKCKPIEYPRPDGVLSFDILDNLMRSGVNHEEDQPSHLRIKEGMEDAPARSFNEFAGPEARFCPAAVYEYPDDQPELIINAQNCVHCKCCSIKTPFEFIEWTVPEAGGGGPAYDLV